MPLYHSTETPGKQIEGLVDFALDVLGRRLIHGKFQVPFKFRSTGSSA